MTFFNIFVGIFIAFVFLAPRARRMGHHLDAHTFPEFLARRFESPFLQVFAGLVIFLFIPLYAAAVLIGGSQFIAVQFEVSYEIALLVFSVISPSEKLLHVIEPKEVSIRAAPLMPSASIEPLPDFTEISSPEMLLHFTDPNDVVN